MSKHLTSSILIVLIGILLVACTSQLGGLPVPTTVSGNNAFDPQPGDGRLVRGDVEIVSASIQAAESFPPRFSLSLAYRLITPCHQLRVIVSEPDGHHRIHLEIFSMEPRDKPCNLMALQTPQQANISLGSFPTGDYTVWVNGHQVGEFKS